MNQQVLFFVTSEFPFGTAETFIENEISYLSQAFDKVIILPLRNVKGSHREVPNNVIVESIDDRQVSWLKVVRTIFLEKEIFKEILRNVLSHPLRNKVLFSSIRNALSIADQIRDAQASHPSAAFLFYTYWLDDGAIAISFLDKKLPKVSRAHGWDVYSERHSYNYLPLRKFLGAKLDRIFTVSENGRGYLAKKTARPEKVRVARLGTFNTPVSIEKYNDSDLNVISLSSVIPLKRVELIGEAAELVSNKKVLWQHYGDGPLFDQIKKRFPNGVFHGQMNNAQVKHALKQLSANAVLVNTSTNEGIPVSMMEAMSFGIPCIGTNVGGVSEIIEDGVNGFLMPANPTGAQVADYIRRYYELTAEEKMRFRSNALTKWCESYNADKNYQQFVCDLQALCAIRSN